MNRHYAPGLGRFTTADPSSLNSIADPGGWNRYAYVQGDPVNFRDPAGTNRQSLCHYSNIMGYGSEGWFFTGLMALVCDDIETGGSAGPARPRVEPPKLNGEITEDQRKKFDTAAQDVVNRLENKKPCADLFGDNGLSKFVNATFEYALIFVKDTAIPNPNPIAATETVNGQPTGKIKINPIGTVNFFGKSPGADLNDTQFRAFVLLHELGHLTGKLGDDTERSDEAESFDKNVLDKCFGIKVQ